MTFQSCVRQSLVSCTSLTGRLRNVRVARCPLYLSEQTSPSAIAMSAKCQKRTFCGAVKNVVFNYLVSESARRAGHLEMLSASPRLRERFDKRADAGNDTMTAWLATQNRSPFYPPAPGERSIHRGAPTAPAMLCGD